MSEENKSRCIVCEGTPQDKDIYRLYRYDSKSVCEVCLQSMIAPVSSSMYLNFLEKGKIVYQNFTKEQTFLKEVYDVAFEEMEDLEETEETYKMIKPKVLKEYLDSKAVGQDNAKKVLSIAVYNHFKRIHLQEETGNRFRKNNILVAGPTGVGKTFITELIADKVAVPFIIADANSITQTGYVGGDVEDILESLYNKANKNLEKAERGIVLIDEIDKLCAKRDSGRDGRDPTGEGAQQALLKIIEGGIFKVEIGTGTDKNDIMFDTSNVLFIVAGAFPSIEGIVRGRELGSNKDFFGGKSETMDQTAVYENIHISDYEKFGLIPELLGRLSVRVSMNPLTPSELISIMTKIDNNLMNQYKSLLEMDSVNLKITPTALKEIAEVAIANKSGARGLQSVFEEILKDVMFECPSDDDFNEFTITKKIVKEKTKII